MKRLLVLLLLALMAILPASALLSGGGGIYSNATCFYVNNTVGAGVQSNYPIMLSLSNASGTSTSNILYTGGLTRPDWKDVNITSSNGVSSYPNWRENNTATATVSTWHLKTPSIATDNTTQVCVYFGNISQSNENSGFSIHNTFLLGDDMLGASLNTTQFLASPSVTNTLSGGIDTIHTTQTTTALASQGFLSITQFGLNTSVRTRTAISTASLAAGNFPGAGYSDRLPFPSAVPVNSATEGHYGGTGHQKWMTQSYLSGTGTTIESAITGDTNYHVMDVSRYGGYNTINTSLDNTLLATSSTNIPTANLNATAFAWTSSVDMTVDWFVVRQSVYPEPYASTPTILTEGAEIPIASFTCTPTSTTLGTPITCTDTSSDTPTNWTYYWGDGNVTDGTQNPSYTYPFTGTFSINQTVNNTLGSSWYNRSNYITITNVSSFTQQDIYLTGQYLITFNVKSSTTNLPIANVTVVDSVSGQSYPSTNGTAFLTLPAGLYYINFIADGYQTKQITYVVDQDETHEVKMVPGTPVTPSPPSIVYIPQQVRIQLIGTDGYYLSGVFIQATPINFTAPENWTETLLGINPSVGIRGTTVYGTTGTDGSWVAPMLQSFQYQINLTRVSDVNYNFTLYPQSTEYRFTIPVAGFVPVSTPSNVVSYSLQNATINETTSEMYQFINMTYNDGSLNTDKLSFVVYDVNSTLVYSQNYTGSAANAQNFSYVQRCGKGQAYTYGFQANQSAYGWINQSSTFQLTSQIELLQNGPAWIGQWIAIVLIVVFGTLFMIYSKPFALIGIPLLTWSFQYVFKLIPGSFLSLIGLGCMLTIGVLVYIRQAENKIQ